MKVSTISRSCRIRCGVVLLAALCLAAPFTPAPLALEISLEENTAERGNIGYVDMQKIFRLYPETHKAKKTYEAVVRQAEEQVSLRRGWVITLRMDLAKFQMERDLLEKSPIAAPAKPPAAPEKKVEPIPLETPAISTEAASGDAPAVSTDTLAAGATRQVIAESFKHLPGMTPAPKNEADSVVINIPGVSGDSLDINPPGNTPAPAAAAPTAYPVQIRERLLDELDEKIKTTRAELAVKEVEFAEYQASVEKNLIEIEGRRTEILLGKIYTAVQEVAKENGVSIVVDKNQILYGQRSVDLTAKVLQKLKGFSL